MKFIIYLIGIKGVDKPQNKGTFNGTVRELKHHLTKQQEGYTEGDDDKVEVFRTRASVKNKKTGESEMRVAYKASSDADFSYVAIGLDKRHLRQLQTTT